MQNHQTGKSTELVWSNYKFGAELDDRYFDQRSLAKAHFRAQTGPLDPPSLLKLTTHSGNPQLKNRK